MMGERMDWKKLLTPFRRTEGGGVREDDASAGRSPFQRDQDRILFSSSFRRLGRKAQVHPLIDNDHIHTRLTHSLEVASVGRSLGFEVGQCIAEELPDEILSPVHMGEIVNAACLAHDIGNPPFGHAGEYALQEWFSRETGKAFCSGLSSRETNDLQRFDGNAMGFRVLVQTEFYRFDGGMRLAYPTLAAMLKYPWTSRRAEDLGKNKFSCFSSDIPAMDDIAERLGMVKKGDQRYARHPLAFLVEAADDICYSILDIEDAFELRMVSFAEIRDMFAEYYSGDGSFDGAMNRPWPERGKVGWIRGSVIHKLVKAAVRAFVEPENYARIMAGTLDEGTDIIGLCDEQSANLISDAKTLGRERIYNHPRKVELEIGAFATIGTMLELFCETVESLDEPPYKSMKVMKLLGMSCPPKNATRYEAIMCFIDYLSGMTDQYATHIGRQFQGWGGPGITR